MFVLYWELKAAQLRNVWYRSTAQVKGYKNNCLEKVSNSPVFLLFGDIIQLCIGLCNFACDGMSCVVVVRWTVAFIRCHGYTCRIYRTSSSLRTVSLSLSRSIPQIVKTPPFHQPRHPLERSTPARDSGNSSHWFPLSPLDVANVEKFSHPKQQETLTPSFKKRNGFEIYIPENDYDIRYWIIIIIILRNSKFENDSICI
jgi:hypothetical protein